jgi:hypothetical protein
MIGAAASCVLMGSRTSMKLRNCSSELTQVRMVIIALMSVC